jgi:hypothetical protein
VGPVGPRRTYSLNGVWAIAPGEESGPSREWVSEVPVPGLVDCATPPYPWKESAYHWYRRTVRPGSALEGRVAILRIDQAMFGTLVKVNGTIAGSDIACYTSQEYDVTALLHADRENEILVRVGRRDTLPPESAVGNDQERESFIPGMWGDVHLLITGTARIAAIQVIPQIAESSVRLKVRVQNHGARERQMTMTAEVRTSPAGEPAGQGTPVSIALHAGGQATVEISVPVSAMRLWSPADPFLYEAVVTVAERAEALDSTAARFGMREFTISGGDFLLNGERILLRGQRFPGTLRGPSACSSIFPGSTTSTSFGITSARCTTGGTTSPTSTGCFSRMNGRSGPRPARANRSRGSFPGGSRTTGTIRALSSGTP